MLSTGTMNLAHALADDALTDDPVKLFLISPDAALFIFLAAKLSILPQAARTESCLPAAGLRMPPGAEAEPRGGT